MLSLLVVKSLKISIYDDNKPKKFLEQVLHGLTVVDELGTSFSYERDNPKVKRNFTLCHELGHFILDHEGAYFAESVDNQEDILEREANIFSRLFHNIREQIIKEFHQFQPSLINRIKQRISNVGFVTSQEYPDLLNQDNWKEIKEECINLKTWLIYNKGKSIAYVWDKEKFSDKEARKKAEIKLLLM